MADLTVDALSELSSPASNDEIGIWDVSAGQYMKIQRSTLVGGVITGGGTIATGGFTLTIPATGTAALITTGTWTPNLKFGGANTGITYNSRYGDYIKVGTLCFVRGEFSVSNVGSATGTATIGDLPFAAAVTNRGGLTLEYAGALVSVTSSIYARIATDYATLSSALADLTHANFQANASIRFWGVYQVG